jgi:hypothetical protein
MARPLPLFLVSLAVALIAFSLGRRDSLTFSLIPISPVELCLSFSYIRIDLRSLTVES